MLGLAKSMLALYTTLAVIGACYGLLAGSVCFGLVWEELKHGKFDLTMTLTATALFGMGLLFVWGGAILWRG